MSRALDRWSRLVTARPFITLAVLLLVTVVLAAGATQRVEPREGTTVEFLPADHRITVAIADIDEHFGESSDVVTVTLVFRGEALTPEGLAQMDLLLDAVVAEPKVAGFLQPVNAIVAPTSLFEAAGLDPASLSQPQIDSILSVPDFSAPLAAMTGVDDDGTSIAIASIKLAGDDDDDPVVDAQRIIADLAADSDGLLRVSAVSPAAVEDEYVEATETGMAPLIMLALLLITALILLFMRTLSDLLLTLAGLVMSVVWIIGAEGWLGPGALAVIGAPSALSTMVPIIMVSLTVDYAIQGVAHYREQLAAGQQVITAVRTGMRVVAVPILLAAVTTIASFLSILFSPIDAVGDFGVVAAVGVALSLVVMLTLLPASRSIIDQRREARGKLREPRPVTSALPGMERAAAAFGAALSRRPAPYLIGVGCVTIVFGFAATGIHSEFSVRDLLPRNGDVVKDLESLDAAVGGSSEVAQILVLAEATETRTLLNLGELAEVMEDEQRRPPAAAGPLEESFESLTRDWVHDSGEPGDRFDPQLAALFDEASAGVRLDPDLMQQFIDRLAEVDPTLDLVLADNPAGTDAILLYFPIYHDDPAASALVQAQIEELWSGDDEAITVIGGSVLAAAIAEQVVEGQTESIATTVAIALGVLALFYWVTVRRPTLAVIAVGPIVLVLVWVLGTMALLDIPYSLITSTITALSIGIGVDYTIHMIHRYREEFGRVRNPEKAAIRTLSITGSALMGSALTTALGFAVLAFAPLEGSRQFGITAAITIGYSLLVSILVVPPAMTVWGAYQNMRLRSTVQQLWDDIDASIEEIDQRHDQEAAAQSPPTGS